jgi:hypothetical protein
MRRRDYAHLHGHAGAGDHDGGDGREQEQGELLDALLQGVPIDRTGIDRVSIGGQCAGLVDGLMFAVSYLTPIFLGKCADIPSGVT